MTYKSYVYFLFYYLLLAKGSLQRDLLGCQSNKALCQNDHVCIEDRLFGHCSPTFNSGQYVYILSSKASTDVTKSLLTFSSQDYSWSDPVVQATLSGIISDFKVYNNDQSRFRDSYDDFIISIYLEGSIIDRDTAKLLLDDEVRKTVWEIFQTIPGSLTERLEKIDGVIASFVDYIAENDDNLGNVADEEFEALIRNGDNTLVDTRVPVSKGSDNDKINPKFNIEGDDERDDIIQSDSLIEELLADTNVDDTNVENKPIEINGNNVETIAREVAAPRSMADTHFKQVEERSYNEETVNNPNSKSNMVWIVAAVSGVALAAVIMGAAIYNHTRKKDRKSDVESLKESGLGSEYQDLCRQRMATKSTEHQIADHPRVTSLNSDQQAGTPSSRDSSTSSWNEEQPCVNNMDISTGHIVLSYMEDHLKNKDKLNMEWSDLSEYEAEPNVSEEGRKLENRERNRYSDALPYDHARIILNRKQSMDENDYINASPITDHDPRNPTYIATQTPLPVTTHDFWQMVWEQKVAIIVHLCSKDESMEPPCHQYWPSESHTIYHKYEINLVSEHVWCDEFVVRSFYLKNTDSQETRTVTQFHYLSWPDLSVPGGIRSLLEFRRKVNKSYKAGKSPIVVACNDGMGRTGSYILIDMVLNRLIKGVKEIDMAATLEHIRDQRAHMVKTKQQFEFSLTAVADEVHAILKTFQ